MAEISRGDMPLGDYEAHGRGVSLQHPEKFCYKNTVFAEKIDKLDLD